MQFKVVSLNLWNGGRLFGPMSEFLLAEQADIMLLQEAYDGQNPAFEPRFRTVRTLQNLFPEYEVMFAPTYLDTRQKEGKLEDGQLLLSRFPLRDQRNLFIDIRYGEYDQDTHQDFTQFPSNLQVVATTIAGQPVTLINVHGPVNYDGTADTDRRLKMRDLILAEVAQSERVIVGGDFNVRPQTRTIRDLAQVLTPLFAEDELTTTFNMEQKKNPGFATSVVDGIFLSPEFKIHERRCPVIDVSDHLPLVATLEL